MAEDRADVLTVSGLDCFYGEVQVLYAEPGGRELYLFTDNRLGRIVKPGGEG